MNEEELKAFHHRLCLLMNEVHKVCVENNIRYTLLGGSLIGAVRHKGFIPWDDDMDIGMPWKDYKRFCEIVTYLKHEWVEFDDPFGNNCHHVFAKAYDKRTTLKEPSMTENNVRGIYIDIFPITFVGNYRWKALLEYHFHNACKALYLRKFYHFEDTLIKCFLYRAVGCFVTTKFLRQLLIRQSERLSKNRSSLSSDLDGTTNGIVPSFLFDSFTLYDFDGFHFYGIEQSDEYLKCVWGDYMELPPIEKRVPGHFAYLNLDLPYKDYVGKGDK